MYKLFSDCIDCKKRSIGCHAKCKSYIRDSRKNEEIKRQKKHDALYKSYDISTFDRLTTVSDYLGYRRARTRKYS